jgi:photosystem II stability/assembly factor-like uncharacterized protein
MALPVELTPLQCALGVALLSTFGFSHLAGANGAFPDSLSIIVPADRPHEITLATNFGLISSIDDGKTWSWSCETAVTTNGYLYQLGPAPEDRLFAVSGNGDLAISDDDACTWSAAKGPALSGSVVDVFPDAVDARRIFAIVSPDGKVGSQSKYTLIATSDGAATFQTLLTGAKSQVLTGVEVPRQASDTIYVTSSSAPNFTPSLLRSIDDGATWQTIDLSADLDASDARLVAIDPQDPNKLFLRATTATGEELAVVDAAGARARSPVALPGGRLTAFARLSGGPILVAGEIVDEAFLYRSIDGGMTFARLAGAPHLRALAEGNGVIWGAADNKVDGYAIASSSDQGETWHPVMRFDQVVGIRECVKASCHDACLNESNRMVWPAAICGTLQSPPADASPSDGPAIQSVDLVATGASGCGCPAEGRGNRGWVELLSILVLLRRRKR